MNLTIEIALLHEETNNYNDAFDEYKELLSLALEENELVMQAKAYRHMGECMLEMQLASKALEHIKMYMKAAKSCGDLFEIQRACVTIGRCYLDLAMTAKVPKEKNIFLSQSQSAFTKSLQLTQKLSQGPASPHTDSKLESELAEMRAVSMFNLGLVSREKSSDSESVKADSYFSQCSALCLKRKLYEMYLRATAERIDLIYNKAVQLFVSQPDKQKAKVIGVEAINLIKSSLKQLSNIPLTSNMKKQRREVQVLEARALVIAGNYLKAAKKYRGLKTKCHSNHDYYNERMKICLRLKGKLESLKEIKCASTKDNIILGQFYEELGVNPVACLYYKQAIESIKDKSDIDRKKLINKLITINLSCGYHKENLPLLEQKLRHLLQKQNQGESVSDRLSARLSCGLILRMLDAWIRSGTIEEHRGRVVGFVTQLDSLAIIAESAAVQIKSTSAVIEIYGLLSTKDKEQYKKDIEKAMEKLNRLKLTSGLKDIDNETEEEMGEEEEDEFNCLSSSDEFNEPELSSVEYSETEYDDQISSDSDMDHVVLTDCQIEELEAVGKRVSSNKKDTFIKRNDKGETMLHVAAIKGSVKQTEHLIRQMKHPVDICDTAGWTPLHDAANHGHTKVVEVLLKYGANMEHTGSPVDRSTPLMEAVNGGSIDTALLLLERGADLWHKNTAGENIGDCIDSWRQRCRDNAAYHEPEARAYRTLTTFIRDKLGARYIEWCRQRKGSATVTATLKTMATHKKNYSKIADRRRTAEVDESDDEKDGKKVLEKESEDENDPVVNYCSAMTSLGSKIIKKSKNKENEDMEKSDNSGYVIGDDWLDNDMPKKNQPIVTEPVYGTYSRTSSRKRQSTLTEENDNVTSRKRIDRHRSLNIVKKPSFSVHMPSSQLEDIFDPDNCVTSTQKCLSQSRSQPSPVTVTYRTIPLLVPLTEKCTVQWLINEVVHRYSVLEPHDPIKDGIVVRLCREDGAVLMPSDELMVALGDVSIGPVRLQAMDITKIVYSDDPMPMIFDNQSLIPDRFMAMYSSIKTSLLLGHCDLNHQSLGHNLLEFLASLHFTQGLQPLKKLSLAGNQLSEDSLNISLTNNHGTVSLAQFIGHHSSSLEELDLSDNGFSGVALSDFLHTIRTKALTNLKILTLSGNPIGSNDFCVMSLILKPILMSCPSLEQLRLDNCLISNLSELAVARNNNLDLSLLPTNLRLLDLSNNPCLLKRDCLDLFFWKCVKSSLQHLSLRGCGSLIADYECLSMASTTNNALTDMIAALVDLVNANQSHIHTLDIGNCGLDSESICHLNRLFTNKNCALRSLICDHNSSLSTSVSCWSGLVHNLSQPLCSVTSLVIDQPLVASYEDFITVIDSVQRKIQMRIGHPLSSLDLFVHNSESINLMKAAVLDHDNKRVSDAEVERVFETCYDSEEQLAQLSVFFVLSVRDLMRDRYKNARVLFEGNMVKFRCAGQ